MESISRDGMDIAFGIYVFQVDASGIRNKDWQICNYKITNSFKHGINADKFRQ